MPTYVETHEVAAGDVLLIGSTWFHIVEVREPRDPRYPGLTFEARAWRYGKAGETSHWGPVRLIAAPYGEKWNWTPRDMIARLWPDLATG